MSKKIGRNAPCPCGSGKKYKKCCLITKEKQKFARESLDHIIKVKHIFISRLDLTNIYRAFLLSFYNLPNMRKLTEAFAVYMEWYLLNCNVEKEAAPSSKTFEVDLPESLKSRLSPGEVLTHLDIFLATPEVVNALSDEERKLMLEWKHKTPSIYWVNEANLDGSVPTVNAVDIFSNQEFKVNLKAHVDAENNQAELARKLNDVIFIATLVETPLENEYMPFSALHYLPKTIKPSLVELVNDSSETPKQNITDASGMSHVKTLIASFFRMGELFKRKGMYQDVEDADWPKAVYKQAAKVFIQNIQTLELYTSHSIWKAVETWFKCAHFERPDVRNANGMAAALEYFTAMSESDPFQEEVTQKALAHKYKSSPATISKNYRYLKAYFDKYLAEEEDGFEQLLEELTEEVEEESPAGMLADLLGILDLEAGAGNKAPEKDRQAAEAFIERAREETDRFEQINLLHQALQLDFNCDEAYMFIGELAEFFQEKEIAIEAYEIAKNLAKQASEKIDRYIEAELRQGLVSKEAADVRTIIEKLSALKADTGTLDSSAQEKYKRDIDTLLLPLLLEAGQLKEAGATISSLEESGIKSSTFLAYAKILYHYFNHGFQDKDTLNQYIKEAQYINPDVINYLEDFQNLPYLFPAKDRHQKEAEGMGFLKLSQDAWERCPELCQYIKTCSTPDQISLDTLNFPNNGE